MADYRLGPAAVRDLDGIFDYTVEYWSLAQAAHYTDLLKAACAALAASPMTGAACDHIRKGYRRRSVERHVIYYRVTGYGIAVVRVLHDRMDPARHL